MKRDQIPVEGRLGWSAKDDKFNLEASPPWTALNTERNWTALEAAEKVAKARGLCEQITESEMRSRDSVTIKATRSHLIGHFLTRPTLTLLLILHCLVSLYDRVFVTLPH